MNTRHKVFADAYKITKGLTKDLIKSYQVAYPNANKEVARVNGYKPLDYFFRLYQGLVTTLAGTLVSLIVIDSSVPTFVSSFETIAKAIG